MKATVVITRLLISVLSGGATNVAGQSEGGLEKGGPAVALQATRAITFAEFLKEVALSNLGYAAQRYNVSIAESGIAAAREFQNPTLAWGSGWDATHGGKQQMPGTYGASLTQAFELGGKRKYRIMGARQNHAAAAATLEDFLRNLKLDAALAFADAMALSSTAEQKRQSAGDLKRLAEAQRERFGAGDISQADLLQTEVEEQQFENELLAAQAAAESASIALCGFLGPDRVETVLIPKGRLDLPAREFDFGTLLEGALRNRPDLTALRHAQEAAVIKIGEEKRNRIPSLAIGPSWTHSTRSENSIAPSPEFDAIGLSLSLPLPLWNQNKAAIATARFTAEQAQKQLEAAELKIEVQIRQALSAYRSALERARHYQGGILKNADAVLEAKRFSYQRGQASLLELIDAQRTANEVRSSYNDALAGQARTLIELQRAAGLWDIEF